MSVRFGNKTMVVCPEHSDLRKQESQMRLGPEEGKGDAAKGTEERDFSLFLGRRLPTISVKVAFLR